MAHVLDHKGDTSGAAREREMAVKFWGQADRDLRERKQLAAERTAKR